METRALPGGAVLVALCVLCLFGCTAEDPAKVSAENNPQADALDVTVMSFNVQNLFDNRDDPGKDDKAYLPIAAKQDPLHIAACNEIEVRSWRDECLYLDWSDAAINHKLDVLAATIRQVESGVDIIALQEVENRAILERLRLEKLGDLGYEPAILIEGSDNRGIDVAFLSRLPLASKPALHPARFPGFPDREGDTRGILQADFELANGAVLTAFSVHFPAPFHPVEMRETAYRQLATLLRALPADRAAVAAGDFNTTGHEDAEKNLLERFARPDWIIAHELGCGDCRGTHYSSYNDSWSFLDMILYSPSRGENATMGIRGESVRIVAGYAQQLRADGTPQRYLSEEKRGVSDHLPIVATLEIK